MFPLCLLTKALRYAMSRGKKFRPREATKPGDSGKARHVKKDYDAQLFLFKCMAFIAEVNERGGLFVEEQKRAQILNQVAKNA